MTSSDPQLKYAYRAFLQIISVASDMYKCMLKLVIKVINANLNT